jgi:ArsR family transcriptional regulator
MPVRLTSGRLIVVDVILATSDRWLSMGGLVTATREAVLLPIADDASCGPVVAVAPLAEEAASSLASVFSALADPVRLRLLSVVAAQGEVCSCHLQEPLGRSQPTISHHTRVLAEAGLIEGDKRGKWTWWRIVPDRLTFVRDALGATPRNQDSRAG